LELRLAVIQVGENPVSKIFIRQKKKACQKTGISFKLFKFSAKIRKSELKKEIERICQNPKNSGVIIQLPMPKKFQPEESFTNLIPEKKDIDVLSERSFGKYFFTGLKILPPIVNGVLHLLKHYKIRIKGKNVVVVGMGRLVGIPLIPQLLREFATPTIINVFTLNPSSFMKEAAILISGVGKPNLIKENMVKKGAVVIDAGTSFKKGRLVGDVDFQRVSKEASYITPVPGGIGPLTVAYLLENLVKLNS
jgi:methylenetetrahydrofolate dehydrogenase (NADP+)/methenyltetrahydrofolate cyclohydrolase